jgi:hypothetical protein
MDAEISVPEPPTDKRGMECKVCGLEVHSPRELVEHWRNKHTCSCTCLVCGKRSRTVSQAWRHIATHVNKVKSIAMVYDISSSAMCHKMLPSQGKKNFHLEHVHKVSGNTCPYTCCTVCEVLKEVFMFNFEEQFQTLIMCRQL